MATLIIDRSTNASSGSIALRQWLNGSWALLFSNPEHFAPNASTPKGYLTCLASVLAENGIKLIELESQAKSWIDESDPERQALALSPLQSEVLDLHAHALSKKIQETARPFVMVLDQNSQCRTTVNYRPESITRPRTLEDIVETIYVLRGDEPATVEDQEDCEQDQGWRVKRW